MTKICIQGAIVGSEIEKETDLDITAKEFIDQLDAVEGDVQIEITSPGGDVFSGIQIANAIARYNRGNISTHAVGLVASIASVILMAGRKLYVDENAFVMIHNPWTIVQGNAKDLEKEITQLNQCREAMMGFYRRHMLVTDDEMKALLDEETWFLGKDFADIMDVEVLACDEQIKIAARVMDKFKKLKDLMMEEKEKTEEEKLEQDIQKDIEENEEKLEEEKVEEEKAEEVEETEEEKPTYEELEKKIEELEKIIEEYKLEEEKPVEARVSGMQSKMQAKINALDLDYKNKIEDLNTQLKVATEELDNAKNESISLKSKLEKVESELSEKVSALENKESVLNSLNQGVLASPLEKSNWRDLKGAEFFAYVKAHPELTR